MAQQRGLLILTIVFLAAGVGFYLASVGGILFGGPSKTDDLGVYSVTIVLLMFGLGTYLLRRARLASPQ